jgi:hypothetical protein
MEHLRERSKKAEFLDTIPCGLVDFYHDFEGIFFLNFRVTFASS